MVLTRSMTLALANNVQQGKPKPPREAHPIFAIICDDYLDYDFVSWPYNFSLTPRVETADYRKVLQMAYLEKLLPNTYDDSTTTIGISVRVKYVHNGEGYDGVRNLSFQFYGNDYKSESLPPLHERISECIDWKLKHADALKGCTVLNVVKVSVCMAEYPQEM